MVTLPAPAKKVRIEVQRVLGFTGLDLDGDFGKKTHARFNQLKDKDPNLGKIQELLGFKGKDVDLDLGPSTRFRFQQLDDHPDAGDWPGLMAKVDPAVSTAPTTGPDTRPSEALHSALNKNERETTFGGPFRFRHKPLPDNKENIEILGTWEDDNIVTVRFPLLTKVPPRGTFTRMTLNKRVVKQTLALWEAWDKAGLMPLILNFGGAFMPRFIRGSTTSLSQHAFGSAFDINVPENPLGKPPKKAGTRGSVRELVPLAHKHGFFWGGNFSRADGMHFEVCKIL